ncbi:G_PROTEIN_RECEP_F1_2 domain-containing protein [Caenorhabditis elegans]|nr:G_PROTEIN_RECEP_F1_2 domain-containing protein [Caenorhabditis elegans]CBX53318.1 G_PROTEIN_RECEP_F1_2 domain-containing protein [Caenorhabditis elegans]|eukprot:NP_001256518.1 FMRFamide Peptide Receptor family [Caenorhabditis elegans]
MKMQISSRTPKRWLAEVNIVDVESSNGRHPRIYVRPLNQLPNNETISITAL